MRNRNVIVMMAASGLLAVGLSAVPAAAASGGAAAASAKPPVIKLKGHKNNVTVSQTKVLAGVMRFKVGHTYNKQGVTDVLQVVSAKHIGRVLKQAQKLNGQDPARAAKKLRKMSTMYGGAATGTKWDVSLPRGTYYVVSINSVFASDHPQKAKFKVVGATRSTPMHAPDAWIEAAVPNVWKTSNLGNALGGWIHFSNTSKELHFANFQGVKKTTTNKDIRTAFKHQGDGLDEFTNNKFFAFNILSPSVTVVFKTGMRAGKYLLVCFMPSEADGTPHAFMGMWKLVTIR